MLHILLAEDNEGDVELVMEALQEHCIPHELHVVQDGTKALEFLEGMGKINQPPIPDIVLLDINLPKVDGPGILAALRKYPGGTHIPVIVVTSSDAPTDRARMAALGISYYFRKPLDFDAYLRLGGIVREVVANKGRDIPDASGRAVLRALLFRNLCCAI